jgi:flagellar hook-associated protein 2
MRLSGLTGTDAAYFDFDPVTPASGAMSETASGGQAASNAAFTLNGIAATSSSNTVTGVLDGVTLTLSKENVGTPATLTVSQNTTSSLTSSLNAFVKAYNEANSTMSALGTYNASTKVAGALQGDSSLRTSQSQLRNVLFSTVAGGSSAYQHLSDIGISVGKDGALALDTTKLNKAISADYAGVANLVAKAGEAYETTLEGIVGTTGTLVTATNSTTSMIKVLTSRASTLSDRLTRIEANYRKQFAALDTLVASMNDTSSYLTQQLSALTKSSNN